jgi:hypothetical protein
MIQFIIVIAVFNDKSKKFSQIHPIFVFILRNKNYDGLSSKQDTLQLRSILLSKETKIVNDAHANFSFLSPFLGPRANIFLPDPFRQAKHRA